MQPGIEFRESSAPSNMSRLLGFVLLAAVVASSQATEVLEIAVRRVTADMDTFEQARVNYINLLLQQPGVKADGEFEAILAPDENQQLATVEEKIRIGMTRYESFEAFQMAQTNLASTPELANFFNTFEVQCFQVVQNLCGPRICFDRWFSRRNVIELAIREVNGDMATFDAARQDYVDFLGRQSGTRSSREYQSRIASNVRVGTTAYRSVEAALQASQVTSASPLAAAYFPLFNLPCYYVIRRVD